MTDTDSDKIIKTVDLRAPIARVWQALTDYKEFGSWFRVDLDQPFETGSVSTGRMTYPGHEGVRWFAVVEHMETERLFSFRWYDSDDSQSAHAMQEPSLLTAFHLQTIPDGTRLTIIESGFSALPEARRIELMRGNTGGWNIQADNLAGYLAQ